MFATVGVLTGDSFPVIIAIMTLITGHPKQHGVVAKVLQILM